MWKKLALVIGILLVATAGFLYYLKSTLETKVIDFARQQGITLAAENIESDFLSQKLRLNNINYKIGNIELENINAEFSGIRIETTPNPKVSAVENKIIFRFNNRSYKISLAKIALTQQSKSHYQIETEQTQINQSTRFDLNGELTKKNFIFQIKEKNNGELKITQNNQTTQISGQNIPTNLIQAILSAPTMIDGISNFKADIERRQNHYLGRINIQTKDGVMNNLNLLEIVAQRLPINYQKDELAQKNINTKFDLMDSEFTFTDKKINVQKSRIITKDLVGSGEGEMDLDSMQCNFIINLQTKDPKYAKITLPLRFYGDCRSPQYKIEITKDFRDGLKKMLKERLK
ncbi:hypothetical protein EDC44_11122 [Cricetibacter osteomyelitidis]|uniref:AsmA-like protein n=1 Tax=Cricetibacter osteomyelitidis TaxID=1521931 RepID=A0A4R2TJR9_9PAST|nr:hypothetical protein [Cricetibacter osteomyelitidis]TCP95072.1 hypothetical protein EDC44_11122 [Cricetibacter osteomyelitidis]